MRRTLVVLALLSLAATASAGWYPKPERDSVQVRVGQTVTVTIHPAWSGISGYEWTPWIFRSTNADVARVEGRMDRPAPGAMRITGISPGRAFAFANWSSRPEFGVHVTVICGREEAVQPAEPRQTTRIGQPVLLRAETPIAERTTFTWYRGLVGDMSVPLAASGPELEFTAAQPGLQHAWVLATTPCSSSTAQFTVEAVVPKRRTARH